MTIVDPKEGTFRPGLLLSMLRLDYIQDYGDAILVVIADQSLICIGGVSSHNTVSFETTLGRFMVRYNDSNPWLQSLRFLLQGVFVDHLIRVQYCQGFNLSRISLLVNLLCYINVLPIPGKQLL